MIAHNSSPTDTDHPVPTADAIVGFMQAWNLDHLVTDLDGALASSTEALQAAEALDAPIAIAHALLVMGGAHAFLGNLDPAEEILTRSLDLFTTLDDAWGIATATVRMNILWATQARFQHGVDRLTAVLPMAQELGDPVVTFSILNDLAAAYRGLTALDLAIPYALEAHAVANEIDDPFCRLVSRVNLGGIYLDHLDMRNATDLFREALTIIEQHPQYQRFAMYCEHNLGDVSMQRHAYDSAVRWYDRAISRARDSEAVDVLVASLLASGKANLAGGHRKEARGRFIEVLETVDRTGFSDVATRAVARWNLDVLDERWTWDTVADLQMALASANGAQAPNRIEILRALADSTARLGDLAASIQHLHAAMEEQERYWRRVASQQSHMAIHVAQANEARQEAERARQERESLDKAMQEMALLNAHHEALLGELQTQSALLDRLAREDSLTNIANRRAFDEHLRAEILEANSAFTIVLADVDDFKRINDRYSHVIGDRVLVAIATILDQVFQNTGFIARFGGDEFGIVLREGHPDVPTLARRLRNAVRAYPWRTIAPGLNVTLSIGIVAFTDIATSGTTDSESLLAQVDERLYQAKRTGKDRVVA